MKRQDPPPGSPPRCPSANPPPRATYRLQLHHKFTFRHAQTILTYLAELGISDLHISPISSARPHSTHGYDVCDFGRFNPDLGGAAGFNHFTRALRREHLGLVLDIVPNHMGIGHTRNLAWIDVLRHGPHSPFARWFDIDWQSPHPGLHHRILLPVLGDHFGRTLERGELRAVADRGALWITYHDLRFPVAAESLKHLPPGIRGPGHSPPSPARIARRLNGQPGVPESFTPLADLLDRQYYRLAFWKAGLEQLNYRRFFDVTHLAGLRMEDPEVFAHTHARLRSLAIKRQIRGLRIDHPDGLRDPLDYLRRLQALLDPHPGGPPPSPDSAFIVVEKILADGEELPLDWPVAGTTGYDVLNLINTLFVDHRNELSFDQLHRQFTRCHRRFDEERYYNKLRILHQLLAPELNSLCRQLTGLLAVDRQGHDYTASQVCAALGRIIAALPVYRTYLDQRHGRLSLTEQRYWVVALDSARRHSPDIPEALFDLLGVWLVLAGAENTPAARRHAIQSWVLRLQQLTAAAMAKGLEDTTFYTWTRFVSLNEVGGNPSRFGLELHEFHSALQQRAARWPNALTATTTHDTKRGEDTRARLNVLSEMPTEWRRHVHQWRDWNTHHKTRIGSMPAPDPNDEYLIYQTLVGTWPNPAPAKPTLEYVDRIQAYHLKAAREAKNRTNWIDPQLPYEAALRRFIDALLDPRRSPRFLADLQRLVTAIALPGLCNSLAQTLLKLTIPGVPDIYQGSEFWDFSLVDPDNRRPVDYTPRRVSLAALKRSWFTAASARSQVARKLARNIADPRVKLFVHWRSLLLRSELPELFRHGTYEPVPVHGTRARHICAFRRAWQSQEILVVVPRFVLGLTDGSRLPTGPTPWRNTSILWSSHLPAARYLNVFTHQLLAPVERSHRLTRAGQSDASRRTAPPSQSRRLPVAAILHEFPVALLKAVS
jgi:(1->4)-alpha-D-glucan 1-alpha-D-glucosylmutase